MLTITNEKNEDLMKRYPDGFFDLILEDPPYGSTNLEWDEELDYNEYFNERFRVLKDNGAILVFSHQPFATDVINGCRKYFRYEIIWQKTQKTNFPNAKKMPLREHENVLVFYKKLPTYNPQKYYSESGKRTKVKQTRKDGFQYSGYSGGFNQVKGYENPDGMMYPGSIVCFSNWNGALFGNNSKASIHPTQKPVDLIRYLILTFSNPGDKVLDGFLGSGTTAIACKEEGRQFYGCEKRKDYFEDSLKRIDKYFAQQNLFLQNGSGSNQKTILDEIDKEGAA